MESWAAEHAFWAVITELPLPIIALDDGGIVRLWNRAAESMFGWTAEEAVGLPLRTVGDEEQADFEDLRTRILHGESIPGYETRRRTKTDQVRDIRVSYSPIRDPNGTIRGTLAVMEDITGRKRIEAERELLLAQAEAAHAEAELQRRRLHTLFMDAPARIAVVRGPDLVYEFANTAYLSTLRDKDILGKPAAEVFPAAEEQGLVASGKRVYETGEPLIGFEQPFTIDYDGDGVPEDRYFNVVLQPLREPDGRIDGVMLFTVDVTELVQARRQAERLAAERDTFMAAAAHDLKTPLTTVKGQTQILQRRLSRLDPDAAAVMQDGLSKIDLAATRMTRLINRLLDITRLEMNQPLDLIRRPVDLVDLVKTVIAEAQGAAPQRQISFNTSLPQLTGRWDAFRLERLIANLLSNATKYSPKGGAIVVSLRREDTEDGAWAVLSVGDRGMGIPAEDLPHIFDRFYRARNVEGQIPGAGIGLADMKGVVEQHGGTVTVESDLGKGTVFTIRLPLAMALS